MILSRVLLHPQERYNLEDFDQEQIDILTDAKYWTKEFLSDQAYVFKGFEVTGLGAPSPCTVSLTDATLINANNSGEFSWYSAPAGASPLSVVLQPGQRNYLELQLANADGTPLTRTFWDPSANDGNGAEFQQIVNTTIDIDISVVVSTTSFSGSSDRIPLAIIDTDNLNTIKLIRDKRNLFYRLGTPANDLAGFTWATQVEPGTTLSLSGVSGSFLVGETINFTGGATAVVQSGASTPLVAIKFTSDSFAVGNTVTGASSGATGTLVTASESFSGADKGIKNMKNMLDAIMTEIRRVKGTDFWFDPEGGSVVGSFNFLNSLMVQNTSQSFVGWTGTNLKISDASGSPSSADVVAKIRILGSSNEYSLQRQDGTGGSGLIPMSDDQVLYVVLPVVGSASYSGVGVGAFNYRVVSRGSFVHNDQNFWIAYRNGSKLYVNGSGELESGEETDIGQDIPKDLLTALGLDETTPNPTYSSDIRGSAGESFLSRLGVLTAAMGDAQEDRSAFIRSSTPVVWTGSQLQFTNDIILEIINSKTGTTTTHTILAANSPISLTNGQMAYVTINRALATQNVTPTIASSTPAQIQATKDIFVLFKREDLGSPSQSFLFLPLSKQVFTQGQSSFLGASGSGSGITKVDLHDPVDTTLPTGTSAIIDGVSVTNGMKVLFSALSSGNNEVYQVSGVGTSLVWTAQYAFPNGLVPSGGDLIVVTQGTAFANQVGEYTSTAWEFNKTTRFFTGANYVEFESIKSSNLSASTTGNIFTVAAAGSENWQIFYTVLRGTIKESGTLLLTHNGTTPAIVKTGVTLNGNTGVTFSTAIVSTNLQLNYTADASGPGATLQYFFYRYSDATGGPAGIPSYSGGGGSTVTAAGSTGDVQFKGSTGNLDANAKINWDTVNEELNLNGLRIAPLSGSVTINNNQVAPSTLFSYSAASYPFAVIEYSIRRGSTWRVGRILMPTNGTDAIGFNDDYSDPYVSGVTLSAIISGGSVAIQYVSDNLGPTGTFKFSIRKWS